MKPPRVELAEWDLLDPRPEREAADRPIRRSVNIPLNELPERTHELPPRAESGRKGVS